MTKTCKHCGGPFNCKGRPFQSVCVTCLELAQKTNEKFYKKPTKEK